MNIVGLTPKSPTNYIEEYHVMSHGSSSIVFNTYLEAEKYIHAMCHYHPYTYEIRKLFVSKKKVENK